MEYIFVGEIINTHGLKGELRVISDFKYKTEVFKQGFTVYVGRFKDKLKIKKIRKHKNYDLITFEELESINDVIIYKGEQIFINAIDLKIDGYFNEQLIKLEVIYKNNSIGFIESIINNNAHDILIINDLKNQKKHFIPYLDEFIEEININTKTIKIKNIKGLIDED